MTPQDRSNLRLRRAGLAATVVLGCSLITVSEVPGLAASGSHPTQATTPQASSSLVPNFLDLPIGERASHGIANPLAPINANGEPAASDTKVSGSAAKQGATGTLPGLTPMVPGSAAGTQTSSTGSGFPTVTGPVSSTSVPAIMAQAYQNAAAHAPATCHIPATLLASIGQVESGNLAGEKITTDHRAYPGVWGPELNGNGYEAIPDTDQGTLDGDTTWDRAVGPMQFIPSTWRMFAVDGDGDGKTDPQDVYDAASTAANYLCYGGRDLSTTAGVNAAVLSYNHSDAYLALVLKWKQSFDTGTSFSQLPTVPALPNQAPRTKVVVVRRYPITVPKLPTSVPTTSTTTVVPGGNTAGSRPTTKVTPTAPATTTARPTSPVTTTAHPSTSATTGSKSSTSQPTVPATTPTAPVTTSTPTSPVTPTSQATSPSTKPTTTPATPKPSTTKPTTTSSSPVVTDTTTGITAQATGRTLKLVAPATGSGYQWTVRDPKNDSVIRVYHSTTAPEFTQRFAVGTYAVSLTYTDAHGARVSDSVTVVLGNGTVSFTKGKSAHTVKPAPATTPTALAATPTPTKQAASSSAPTSSASSHTTTSSTKTSSTTASSTASTSSTPSGR